jgi:hypothetical protein
LPAPRTAIFRIAMVMLLILGSYGWNILEPLEVV